MIEKHIVASNKLELRDIDWAHARRVGLSEDEQSFLPYFADIEGQTVFYLMEILKLPAARDPDTIAFVTMWNYEEYFHSYALTRLLAECGHPIPDSTQVRLGARFRARFEDAVQTVLARLFPRAFVALWMAWGASQEALTLRGYEHIGRNTQNPVLRVLCERIAKQERRHFAWYFNSARAALAKSRLAQKLTRFMFEKFWTPVGVGVKSQQETRHMVKSLLSGAEVSDVMAGIDRKMATLPGFEGFDVMTRYAASLGLGGLPRKATEAPRQPESLAA